MATVAELLAQQGQSKSIDTLLAEFDKQQGKQKSVAELLAEKDQSKPEPVKPVMGRDATTMSVLEPSRKEQEETTRQNALAFMKKHPMPAGIPSAEEETLRQDVYDPVDVVVDVATGFMSTPFKTAVRKGVPIVKNVAKTVGREIAESALVGGGMQTAQNLEAGPIGTMLAGLASGVGGRAAVTGLRQLGKVGVRGATEAVGSKVGDDTLGGFVRTKAEGFYKRAWDENRDIKRLVDEVKARTGKELPPDKNPYLRRMAEKNVASAKTALDLDEFAKIVNPIHIKEKGAFEEYLIALRSLDQVKNGVEPEIPLEQAHQIIMGVPEHFKATQKRLVDFADNLLVKQRQAGFIGPGTEQQLRQKWGDSYSPFYRVFEDGELENLKIADFKKVLGEKATIDKMVGSGREILSPLDSFVQQTEMLNKRIARNEVHKGLLEIAETGTDVVKEITAKEARGQGVNPVVAWVNGKPRYLDIPADIYETLNTASRGNPNVFIQVMKPFTTALRKGAVQYNPLFAMYNVIRDGVMAGITSKGGLLPWEGHFKGLYHMLKKDDIWKRALESGAVGSEFIAQGKGGRVTADKMLKGGDVLGSINRKVNPFHWFSIVNEALEKAPRIGEFASMTDDPSVLRRLGGLFGQKHVPAPDIIAGDAGRDLTVNFGRFGTDTKTPNEVIAFFNAAMQGGDKMVRTFKDKPVQTGLRVLTYVTLPSIALWFNNHDDPRYQELSQNQKDRYWWIVTKDNMVPVIKPFDFAVFGNVAERMLTKMAGEDPDAFEDFATNVGETLLPAVVPTLPLVLGEWATNYNTWQDRPIVPMREDALPAEHQWGPETSETAKWLGKYTGLSPRKIEHAIYGFSGKTGRYITRAVDKMAELRGVRGEAPARGLLPEAYRYPKSVDDFYKRKEELDGLKKALEKTGQKQKGYNPFQHYIINRVAREIAPMWQAIRDVYGDTELTGEEKQDIMDDINRVIMNLARLSLSKPAIDTKTNTFMQR